MAKQETSEIGYLFNGNLRSMFTLLLLKIDHPATYKPLFQRSHSHRFVLWKDKASSRTFPVEVGKKNPSQIKLPSAMLKINRKI